MWQIHLRFIESFDWIKDMFSTSETFPEMLYYGLINAVHLDALTWNKLQTDEGFDIEILVVRIDKEKYDKNYASLQINRSREH